jgi:hypothetical protein
LLLLSTGHCEKPMSDVKYYLIDKSGKAAKFYSDILAKEKDLWAHIMLTHIEKQTPLEIGDAMIARDELIEAGLKWGEDFYIKKESK